MRVAGVGLPPAAPTRCIGDVPVAKRIVSAGPHVPPRTSVALGVISCTAPPPAGTFFKRPSAKKPIQRLSGDHMGSCASSVPESWCASTWSSDRTHSAGRAPGAPALKTNARPSGDNANAGALTVVLIAVKNVVPSEGNTGKLIASTEGDVGDTR